MQELSNDEQIQQLEVNIEELRAAVKIGEALDRLHKNRDFKSLITNGLFKEEAARVVRLKGADEFQSEDRQADLDKMITSIGFLQAYFRRIYRQADLADRTIAQNLATIAEIENEDEEEV